MLRTLGFRGLSPLEHRSVAVTATSLRTAEIRPVSTFAREKPVSADGSGVNAAKTWLFHIFFHSCGKLRGETLRPRRRGRDFNIAAGALTSATRIADNRAIDTPPARSLLLSFSAIAVRRYRGFEHHGKRTFQPNRRRRAAHPRLPGPHEHQERPASSSSAGAPRAASA